MGETGFLIFLLIAVASLSAGFGLLIYRMIRGYRKGEVPLFMILIACVFLAAFCIFYPIYFGQFKADALTFIKAFLLSIHNSIRLFIVDCDFEIIFGATEHLSDGLRSFYHGVCAIIFVTSPILTFSFVLSFFKNTVSIIKFKSIFRKDYYIFSELNEKSIVLAEDIREKKPHATIVFTDVRDEENDEINEIVERAKVISSIIFKKDVTSLNLSKNPNKTMRVFLMSEDDDKNIEAYNSLYRVYKERENVSLYLFSKSSVSGLTFNRPKDVSVRKLKAFRIDTDSFLVSNYLYREGYELFASAKKIEGQKDKVISIVIVGLGRYGKVFLKNIVWYCQMIGYYLKINVFDGDPKAEEIFRNECPELLDENINGKVIPGDAQYDITIHPGIYTGTDEFINGIKAIKDVTYVFLSLGTDNLNISTALTLRELYERLGLKPIIKTYRPICDKETTFETATNYRGDEYKITFIGDYRTSYSYDTLIDNQFEKEGLEVNRGYGGSDIDFWFYEYNYQSSCATAIHNKAKEMCGINLNRAPSELTKDELEELAVLEHRRWNAWIRSQGFVWSKGYDRASRNVLGKTHHNIVPFDKLTDEDKFKDIKVILKKHD